MSDNLTLLCTLEGRGWAEAVLSVGDDKITVTASYLSDAIGDLLYAVISLLEGAPEASCRWQEEPGEYRWLFLRREEQIQIRIVDFKKTFAHQRDEEGTVLLMTECSLHEFARKVSEQMNRLLVTLGPESYGQTWGYPFPQAAHQYLKHLL